MMMPESCNAARHHLILEDQAVVMSLGLVGLLLLCQGTDDLASYLLSLCCMYYVDNSDYLIKIDIVSYLIQILDTYSHVPNKY